MFNKINVFGLIKNHVDTWVDDSTNRYRPWDFVLFLVVPLSVAAILTFYLNVQLDSGLANLLATVLAIVTGLLFNLLVIIFDISRKNKETFKQLHRIPDFLRQIYVNISFAILVSIFAVIVILIATLNNWSSIPLSILSFLTYFLTALFLLTLLMILKRIDTLLLEDFKDYKKDDKSL